ncbi:PAS domain S-box protein [Desulfococcaceae bacterium HSG8]|nr:PAS domain S-box protein [Desulfococcaceae bacterium HSG8]
MKRIKRIIKIRSAIAVILVATSFFTTITGCKGHMEDPLTAEERAWLNKHDDKIRLVPSSAYPPIDFFDEDGIQKGITTDIISAIERKLDFRVKRVYVNTWNEMVEAVENHDADIIGSIQDTPERREFLDFTRPYITVPNVIIVKKDADGPLILNRMKEKKVAIVKGYATYKFVKQKNPLIDIVPVKDNTEGLQRVSFGRTDAFVTDTAVASYYIEKLGISNLKVAGNVGFEWNLCLASRKDLPVLNRILEKGLSLVTHEEREIIYNKWIRLETKPFYNSREFWFILSGLSGTAFLVILIILLWNRILRHQVGQRTAKLDESNKQLRASEERFRTLVGNIPGVGYRCACDKHWSVEFISNEIEVLSGYPASDFLSNQKRSYASIIYPDDVQLVEDIVLGRIDRKETFTIEYRIVRADGDIRWVFEKGQGVFGEGGNLHYLDGVIMDITERREAEERFRVLSQISPVGIFIADADGKTTYWNERLREITGMSTDEGKGTGWADGIHPDDRERVFAEWYESAEARADFRSEYRFVDRKGKVTWAIGQAVAMKDSNDEIICFVGNITDITDRRQAEEEIRHLRNYLSNIIDSMPSVLVGVDIDGKVSQWNKTAEQTTGVSACVAQGKTLSDVFPRMASEMEKIAESIRTRETKQEQKRPRVSENGTCYEDVTIYPLIANGVEGAVIRIDDVTDKVRMEEMMIQSEKMLSVGGLAAGMAHEINNPLAGMMQTADVMSNRLTDLAMPANMRAADEVGISMDDIRAFMEKRGIPRMIRAINESGRRAAHIVDNMLSFARKSEAKVSYHALSELLDKTLELAATDYDLKKHYDFKLIEVKKEYEDNLLPVPCEGGKIQQVLLNILRNGAQAMQDAGTEKPRFIIRTRVEKERKMVCTEIEDNGPGMDEETRKRVFEPFYTTKPVRVGTGLGLSVSYFIIIENHEGEMAVESGPGSGAKFIIRLPLENGKA